MKKLLCILLLGSLNSCAKLGSYTTWLKSESGSPEVTKQVNLDSEKGSKEDSVCRNVLEKSLMSFNPDLPIVGADLDRVINLIVQYQACEEVKRDDRIADVLLKLLKRVQILEGELNMLKGEGLGAGQ
jgi:hypothetical protein